MIIWIVGLSGSGKTTIGKEMYKLWKTRAPNTVMVDGDDVRRMLGNDADPGDYSIEGRYKNAKRIVEICSWLDRQKINVICCILCIFEDIMADNKSIFSEYYQVFLDAPMELLKSRDPKGLYYRAFQGDEKNVVGIDIPFPSPTNSDLVIDMKSSPLSPYWQAECILKRAGVITEAFD